MAGRPRKVSSLAEKELDKAQLQFDVFDQQVKDLTMDRMNEAPKQEIEPQTKISQIDAAKAKEIYLKPDKTISSPDKFNEKYRSQWEFAKQMVQFVAENIEIIGENIELWTKPFAGVPAQFWKVPVNKAVWGPRHLAEQIARKTYHRLVMQKSTSTGGDGMGEYYGAMAAETTIARLKATPVSSRKSIFMGAEF
jgi:hypothetical protein